MSCTVSVLGLSSGHCVWNKWFRGVEGGNGGPCTKSMKTCRRTMMKIIMEGKIWEGKRRGGGEDGCAKRRET